MKKVISLALALVLSLSLALPAAAATRSPEKKPDKPSSSSPKTGDMISLWVGGMAVSGAGLSVIMASRKKED